jgi:glycine cleavage system H lipoate-binding protein
MAESRAEKTGWILKMKHQNQTDQHNELGIKKTKKNRRYCRTDRNK